MQSLLACVPGREALLAEECARAPAPIRRAAQGLQSPGWLSVELPDDVSGAAPCLAFCSQVLPEPRFVECASVQAWASTILEVVQACLLEPPAPWRLHVFCHDLRGAALRPTRARLIEQALRAGLKQKRRQLLRQLVPGDSPWEPREVLVQVALLTPQQGAISICSAAQRQRLRHLLSRYPGGVVPVVDDRAPPARAYRKLLEAQALLGRQCQPAEGCVDLGAAPGSWTYMALAQGARVLAVDRSPLRDDLMGHAELTFCRGDAFAHRPPAEALPVWLLCDVIAAPGRTLALLQRWLEQAQCTYFVVTFKFRGGIDWQVLEDCKRLLRRTCRHFMLRCLWHNKNEVTALGEVQARS